MTTDKAFEQLKLAALEVKALLIDIDENIHPSVDEIEKLASRIAVLDEHIVIYKFLQTQKELSPSFNIHLKVMEKVSPVTPSETIATSTIKETAKEIIADEHVEGTVNVAHKIEMGLNDKFRMINELFKQSTTEFNLAIEQLNLFDSLEKSRAYLDELKRLYGWKEDGELTIRLYQLNQKRFA
jgi:hypothetical protein